MRQRGREEDGRGEGEKKKYKYDIQDMKICEGDKDAQRIKSPSSCNFYTQKRCAVLGRVWPSASMPRSSLSSYPNLASPPGLP